MAKKRRLSNKPQTSIHQIEKPIEWQLGVSAVFANQLLVQVDDYECHLSFFEIQPPLIVGTPEEKKKAIAELKAVPARCVARIVVSKERLQGFVDAIQGTIDKIRETKGSVNGKE